MDLGFIGGCLTGFTYIDVDKESREFVCMIAWGMVLGDIVRPIEVARVQIITKLALGFAATYPTETQVHEFAFAFDYGIVYYSLSCQVVALYRGWRLFTTHSGECLTDGYHFLGCNVQCA